MRFAVMGLCFLLGTAVRADFDLNVALWRGESLSVILPDECHEITAGVPGLAVERGTLLPVRYNTSPKSLEYRFVADRAAYGSATPGIGFATVTAAADLRPGTYRCGQLVVRVVDRVLPPAAEWKYYLDLWQHPWAVARVKGCVPFSEAHYRAMEPFWRMLAAAGQKTLTVSLLERPWNCQCYDAYHAMVTRTRKADGSWAFDYAVFDRYVAFGRACGLGPDISCYTMCPWGNLVNYQDESGKMVRIEAKAGTPVFEEYWGAFLVDFSKHLAAKGWLGHTYISLDERSPEELRHTVEVVRKYAPALKIAMAGNRRPSEFKGVSIDSYAQCMAHVDKPFLAEVPQRRAEGKHTTYYICCGPKRPNTFMSSGPGEAFVCGFYPAACGLDGLLRWAYNSWGADSNNDMTYTRWTAGDIALVYPDGSPSWRFLDLKNGIQQAEKFRILREGNVRTKELDALAAAFDNARLLKDADCTALKRRVLDTLNR